MLVWQLVAGRSRSHGLAGGGFAARLFTGSCEGNVSVGKIFANVHIHTEPRWMPKKLKQFMYWCVARPAKTLIHLLLTELSNDTCHTF